MEIAASAKAKKQLTTTPTLITVFLTFKGSVCLIVKNNVTNSKPVPTNPPRLPERSSGFHATS